MNDHEHNGHEAIDGQVRLAFADLVPADAEARLREIMRSHWNTLAGSGTVRPRRSWLAAPRSRVAASLVLMSGVTAGVVLLSIHGGATAALAQAIQAATEARSLHAKGYRLADGELKLEVQVWYSAELGVREQEDSARRKAIRVDDRRYEWIYRDVTRTVIQGPTRDPVGGVRKVLDPVRALERLKAKRDAGLDASLAGVRGQAYVAAIADQPRRRHVFWLETQGRLLRYEEQQLESGTWVPDERIDLVYDLDLDPKLFTADFGPGVRLIDRTKALSGFDVEKAIATAERLGIVLAVHEVRRVDNDTVFVLLTSRGSPEVIERVGPIIDSSMAVHGTFMPWTNGRRLPDGKWVEGMMPVEIAHWRRGGIGFTWALLRHVQSTLTSDGLLPMCFNVYSSDAWQAALAADGKPTWLWAEKDVVTLRIPTQAETLDAVLADVYEQTQSLGDAAANNAPWLNLKPRAYTPEQVEEEVARGTPRDQAERMSVGPLAHPEQITLDAWRAEVRAMLNEFDAQRGKTARE